MRTRGDRAAENEDAFLFPISFGEGFSFSTKRSLQLDMHALYLRHFTLKLIVYRERNTVNRF